MSRFSPQVAPTWGQSLADALGAGVGTYLQSRRQKQVDDRQATQDKLAATERERQHTREGQQDELARALQDSTMRSRGYIPTAERGADSRTVLPGSAIDSIVGAGSGPMFAAALAHPDATSTRYGANVGGYAYDNESPAAQNERLALALRQSEVNRNNAQATRDAQPVAHAPLMGSPEWMQSQRFIAALGRDSHAQDRTYDINHPTTEPSAGKAPSDGQIQAAMFAERMRSAEALLQQHEKGGAATTGTAMAGGIPLIGNYARNLVSSDEQQLYRQAQEDWVRAKLRKESGAAIGSDEMKQEIATYFKQPGDSDAVVAQKAARRAEATRLLRMSGGNAATMFDRPSDPARAPLPARGGSGNVNLDKPQGRTLTVKGKTFQVPE